MSEKKKDEKPVEDKKCKDSKCCKHEKNGSKDCKNAASKEAKEDFEDKYIRLMAEFQNFKKRNEKEKSAIYKLANEALITELLNVMDSFELALSAGDSKDSEGLLMIQKQIASILEKAGLSKIDSLGEEFDPNRHHAVKSVEEDEGKSGTVAEVLKEGYVLSDKVIRPAMVVVVE